MTAESFLFQLRKQESQIKATFNTQYAQSETLMLFRTHLLSLAQDARNYVITNCNIESPDFSYQVKEICKFGIMLAIDAAATRICAQHSTGWEKIAPSVANCSIRSECVAIYDILLTHLKAIDTMYIPDEIERFSPTNEKLRLLQKSYFAKQEQQSKQVQSNGQKTNRLFGSRG